MSVPTVSGIAVSSNKIFGNQLLTRRRNLTPFVELVNIVFTRVDIFEIHTYFPKIRQDFPPAVRL